MQKPSSLNKERFSIENVRQAIIIQQTAPNSPESLKALKFTDCFKQSPSCIPTCVQMYKTNDVDIIRHFALSTINSIVSSNWKSLTKTQKASMIELCINYVLKGTKGVIEEKPFIKEKVSDIVCSVALNSWPNGWNTFFKDILAIANRSEREQELVLKILLNLRLETELNCRLSLGKRESMKQSLKSYSNEIYTLTERILTTQTEIYNNSTTNINLNENENKKAEIIILTALKCLAPNIQFPMEAIFREKLVDGLCYLGRKRPFFTKCVECIISIINRRSVVPQNISNAQYKRKIHMIWKFIVDSLETILRECSDKDELKELLELLAEAARYLVQNHKYVTYRKDSGKDLRGHFVSLLTNVFSALEGKQIVFVFDLWKILFETNFLSFMKQDLERLLKGLFEISMQHLNKVDEGSEIPRNIQSTILLLLRRVMLCKNEFFLDLCIKYIETLLAKTKQMGFCTKDSKTRLEWDNILKVLRLAFTQECFSVESLRNNSKKELLNRCQMIHSLLLSDIKDPLIMELILKFYVRFTPLLNINNNSFNNTLKRIFSIFDIFMFPNRVTNDPVLFKNIIAVRKAAVYALIMLSKSCRKKFAPLYDQIAEACTRVFKNIHSEEDMSGLYEFLLNISDNKQLERKRANMIASTFSNAIKQFTSPEITNLFEGNKILQMLKPGPETAKVRQVIRVAINTLNALLRGATKSKVSYSSDYRANIITVMVLNSFQYEEIWNLAKSAIPTITKLCLALSSLFDGKIPIESLPEEFQVILYDRSKVEYFKKRIEGDKKRVEHFKSIWNWLTDLRDISYCFLSLSCNLSDSFFTSDPNFFKETVFHSLIKQPEQSLRSLTEKIMSPLTMRCAAATPQYLNSFLAPLLSFYFETICNCLESDWKTSEQLENSPRNSPEDIEKEIEFQSELRFLTRSVSKFIFSLSLEIVLRGPYDPPPNTLKPNRGWRKSENLLPKGQRKSDGFRSNKIFYSFMLKTETILHPFARLVVFFLGCRDEISRNNVYHFLLGLAKNLDDEKRYFELLSRFMVEAIRMQPIIKDVDDILVQFITYMISVLNKLNKTFTKEVLESQLDAVASKEDIEFLLNGFNSRDNIFQRKKTRQFLLKLSGFESSILFFGKTGVLTDSVRRRKGSSRRHNVNTQYMSVERLPFFDGNE